MIPSSPAEHKPDLSRAVMLGSFPYGWEGVTATRLTGEKDIHGKPLEAQLPFPANFRKSFTHPPGTVIVGAPKRGGFWEKFELKEPAGYDEMSEIDQKKARAHYRRCLVRKNQCKEVRYIVWHDRSLRRVDNVLRKQLAGMSPEEQKKLIQSATKGGAL